jgi:hypothetical protein
LWTNWKPKSKSLRGNTTPLSLRAKHQFSPSCHKFLNHVYVVGNNQTKSELATNKKKKKKKMELNSPWSTGVPEGSLRVQQV